MARPAPEGRDPALHEFEASLTGEPSPTTRRLAPWALVWAVTLALTALSSAQSLDRYRDFRSGWPWDLAYNNQWFWALLDGSQTLSIQPINAWGNEGPSIWSRTHLDPIRLAVVPFYATWPGPETLLVANNVILWWVVPSAFGLLLAESGSARLALAGAALVPMTPLLWPMLWNDFREMQLALPFVLWAIWGYRTRHRGLAIFGAIGMLASREEFGVMLATFALLPPREPEEIGVGYAWARWSAYVGVAWVALVFLGYEHLTVSWNAPELYLGHLGQPKPSAWLTARAAWSLVVIGAGPWALLALLAPRVAILALPWAWGLASGRWLLPEIGTFRWGSVRYAAPMVAVLVAAGLIGYANLARRAAPRRRGWIYPAAAWIVAAAGFALADADIAARMRRIEWPISRAEAREAWRWIDQVGPDEAVVAAYEVSAPLSTRRVLLSNRLEPSIPKGYPRLDPRFRWAFLRVDDLPARTLLDQGFEQVHRGEFLAIYRRSRPGP